MSGMAFGVFRTSAVGPEALIRTENILSVDLEMLQEGDDDRRKENGISILEYICNDALSRRGQMPSHLGSRREILGRNDIVNT